MSGADTVVAINNLSLQFDTFALQKVNLELKKGEYKVLLGPTGGGKTVLLETILGLHRPQSGEIKINEKVINELLPEERNIGYVPQDYSLFPNMTVKENISFGPRLRGVQEQQICTKVKELTTLMGIEHLSNRYIANLSGGEKQRVAMARALAIEPEVLILDEPLSALDEGRRSELAAELKRIQRSVNGTFLHVCHNLDEAAQVADTVAIINQGQIIQDGTIWDVLYKPKTAFIAKFTGTQNVFSVTHVESSEPQIELNDGARLLCKEPIGSSTHIAVRPEAIRFGDERVMQEGTNVLSVTIENVLSRAVSYELTATGTDKSIKWKVNIPRNQNSHPPQLGDRAMIQIPAEGIWIIPNSKKTVA